MENQDDKEFAEKFMKLIDVKPNQFHPLVFVYGEPEVGKNVYVGLLSEVNARGAKVKIGDNCDIASFVSINANDTHKKCIEVADEKESKPITIENNVFIGSHSFIKGGAHIGHHSVVGAGTIVEGVEIPPYSLVVGNPMKVKAGYYKEK